jgi:hypothetical protein
MRTLHGSGAAGALAIAAMVLVAGAAPAAADTMKECSVKFHAAKTAGTLNGMDWKSFRAAQCGDSKTVANPMVPATSTAAATTATATPVAKVDEAAPAPTTPAMRAKALRRRPRPAPRCIRQRSTRNMPACRLARGG